MSERAVEERRGWASDVMGVVVYSIADLRANDWQARRDALDRNRRARGIGKSHIRFEGDKVLTARMGTARPKVT